MMTPHPPFPVDVQPLNVGCADDVILIPSSKLLMALQAVKVQLEALTTLMPVQVLQSAVHSTSDAFE